MVIFDDLFFDLLQCVCLFIHKMFFFSLRDTYFIICCCLKTADMDEEEEEERAHVAQVCPINGFFLPFLPTKTLHHRM